MLAAKLGVSAKSLEGIYKRVKELPFDSERKRMSVLVHHQGGRLLCTKGAPDLLLEQCSYILWDGKVVPLTASLRQKVAAGSEQMAADALRVLGMAIVICGRMTPVRRSRRRKASSPLSA